MKKIYILAFALVGMVFSSNAQLIDDDMESYPLVPLDQGHWTTWTSGATAESLVIVNTYGHSGTQSGMIGDDGVQDPILKLGNESMGVFTLSWWNYIPSGKGGYYNFQENEIPGSGAWGLNVYFNPETATNEWAGFGFVFDDSNPAVQVSNAFEYPEDTWFKITHEIDLDTDTVTMYLDGVEIYTGGFYTNGLLGSVDFYSVSSNNELYIDDIFFDDGLVGTEDFTADTFSVYPNPVKDVLNIQTKATVDQVVVYDILGKVVLAAQPGVISPKVDMSTLPSGVYMVKVAIGNSSKTVKVIK